MMNFVLSSNAEAALLGDFTATAADGIFKTVKVGLFTDQQDLNNGMTLAALGIPTDATLDNLVAITWETDPHINGSGSAWQLNSTNVVNYTATDPSTPISIAGFYVVDSTDPTLLLGAAAFDAEYIFTSDAQELSFVVQLSLGSGYVGGHPNQIS